MWKEVFGFVSQVFSVTRKTQQHEEDIKEIRQEFRALAEAFQQRSFEQQRELDSAAHERENLLLRLQLLLRSERQLPPVETKDEDESEALRAQIEVLKKENEALRKRLNEERNNTDGTDGGEA